MSILFPMFCLFLSVQGLKTGPVTGMQVGVDMQDKKPQQGSGLEQCVALGISVIDKLGV